ncbi:hypothetical protein COL99_24305 [Bacillus toyonensis]|uniref:hypothetical protein n=1 Tax=Bacillus cereus group TaxID=86661 RepID=UPI000BF82542|nr:MULTISPECIES: hypothetical protein [Bacillus cereus group]MDA1641916.1 hypothetical protein [Bacillus cereus group sp. TH177-1LC]PGC09919.1 hypothetical protein COL99_24305 [Bacillus toyonensis]PGC81694.1 hypothetical protein COM28_10070 [Bacillus toyonensis]PHD33517.1 hypothetical protein COF48_17065 [Bacillus toyonensis]
MQLYQNGEVGSKKHGVILQPTGGMKNVKRTILQSVCLDDLMEVLTEEQYKDLENAFGSQRFLVWGVNDTNITNKRYHLIEKGFDVWFYRKWRYFLKAKVVCGFHNPKVASILWPPAKNGRNFNNLYFCASDSLKEINLSTPEVNEILWGKAKKVALRGMNVCVDGTAIDLMKLM